MEEIASYNKKFDQEASAICDELLRVIDATIGRQTTCKIWHGAPVWFDDDNPVVGYSVRKRGVQLLFWSGCSFDESTLSQVGEKYPTAEARYMSVDEIKVADMRRWLKKSLKLQWDYKNIVKRRGILLPLKGSPSTAAIQQAIVRARQSKTSLI